MLAEVHLGPPRIIDHGSKFEDEFSGWRSLPRIRAARSMPPEFEMGDRGIVNALEVCDRLRKKVEWWDHAGQL